MADASCVSDARPVQEFGTVVVVGGGCYGSWYVRQLQRALAAGAVRIDRLLVVDRDPDCRVGRESPAPSGDVAASASGTGIQRPAPQLVVAEWAAFFADYLADASQHPAAAARDAIVPSPLMPHLMYRWIADRMRTRWPARHIQAIPYGEGLDVPWQRAGDDGTHYASFATWMCPINCIEPARCPHTRGARDWTLPVTLARHARTTTAPGAAVVGPYVFHCTHRAYGVGMIDVASVLAAEADLAHRAATGPVDAVVGTVSHCHGALSRMVVGALPG